MRRNVQLFAILAICAGLMTFAPRSADAAILIDLVPPSETIGVGSTAETSVRISGLGNSVAPSLGTFDIDLSFDPSLIGFVSGTYGDPILGDQLDLFGLGSITATTPGAGTVNLFELSLDSSDDLNTLQADAFILVTLTFTALSPGTSPLNLSLNALGDTDGALLLAESSNGLIKVTTGVPAPSPFVLLASAVGLLGAVSRLRSRASQR